MRNSHHRIYHRSLSSPASFSADKMETDKRYAATTDVPDSLKSPLGGSTKGEYSIRGDFREGRAAYLDMSSTTPLDPRVFDKMAPYMVRDFFRSRFFLLLHRMHFPNVLILFSIRRLDPMATPIPERTNMDGTPNVL